MIRRLHISLATGPAAVDVHISDPVELDGYWTCGYCIGWPDGPAKGEGRGADAIQSLYLALQSIALALYASEYHASGALYWDEPGRGYGFPIPKPARDNLIGEDRDSQL